MIQLPAKIRTTLFNATIEVEPFQLFSHENDRVLILLYIGSTLNGYPILGRSLSDIRNSDGLYSSYTGPVYIYGPEPLWLGGLLPGGTQSQGHIIVHGIYRA